jgi:hypothetical protein
MDTNLERHRALINEENAKDQEELGSVPDRET